MGKVLFLIVVVALLTVQLVSADELFMTLKGQKTGTINGDITTKAHKDAVGVLAYNHEIVSPRDIASGLPTGKRQHKPLTITKRLDRSTPLLYNVLVTNENLPTVTIFFDRPTSNGVMENYYSVKLTNANIASIRMRYDPAQKGTNWPDAPIEEVSFTYQKIEWTFTTGGITAMDDWEAPVV